MDADFDSAGFGSFGKGDRQRQNSPFDVCFDFRDVNGRVDGQKQFTLAAMNNKEAIFKTNLDSGGVNAWHFHYDFS